MSDTLSPAPYAAEEAIPIWEILESAPFGILLTKDKRVLFVNRCLADWIGLPSSVLRGLTSNTAKTSGLGWIFEDYEELVLSGNKGEIRLLRRCVILPSGSEACFFDDLTEETRLRRERNALEQLARTLEIHDTETGLLNRAAILEELENQVNRSRRYGNVLSVIQMRLVSELEKPLSLSLMSFAQELSAELRWSDKIGYLGKRAFLLILPETSEKDAQFLAAKLGRDRVSLAKVPDWTLEVTVAAWQTGDDVGRLLRRFGMGRYSE